MALVNINYWSASLLKESACGVLLPDRQPQKGPFPVFYLLHGLSDDHTAWQRWTSLERYARELPLIIVMAEGHRSFYCDATNGFAYEAAIVKDLIGFIDGHFRTIKSGRGRVIGGLSMGGYGAMKLGLKYPAKFCSVSAHSGVYLHTAERWWERDELSWMAEARRIYGSEEAIRDNDVFALAEKLAPSRAPALRVDCGRDDVLLRDNQALHAHLKRLKIKHEYHEYPGGHNWAYWDEHVQEALRFHCGVLGIA